MANYYIRQIAMRQLVTSLKTALLLLFFLKHSKFKEVSRLITGIAFVTSRSSSKDSRSMYIGGHVRRCFPFTTWSFTDLAPHFIKLTTSCRTDYHTGTPGCRSNEPSCPYG